MGVPPLPAVPPSPRQVTDQSPAVGAVLRPRTRAVWRHPSASPQNVFTSLPDLGPRGEHKMRLGWSLISTGMW